MAAVHPKGDPPDCLHLSTPASLLLLMDDHEPIVHPCCTIDALFRLHAVPAEGRNLEQVHMPLGSSCRHPQTSCLSQATLRTTCASTLSSTSPSLVRACIHAATWSLLI